MELQPGDSVAGWVVARQLSAGAMGVTYLAQHPRLPRLDVVKVISPFLAANDDYRQRFLREADVVARLQHPHVVTVHDRGEDSGLLYIAMQYVPDGDLRALLTARGRLPIRAALAIGEQLASALDAAHEQGVVHRDVKPENVLMLRSDVDDPYAVLADFGIAHSEAATALTADGSVLATPGYAAPEQVEGGALSGATDQYALGCLVFEMLSGRVPFPRSTPAAALIAHVTEPPPDLSTFAPDSPAALDAAIRRALAKQPQERFSSCRDFIAAACAATAATPADEARETVAMAAAGNVAPDPAHSPERPRRRLWSPRALAGLGVVVIALTVVVALVFTASTKHEPGPKKLVPAVVAGVLQPSTKRGGTLQLAYRLPCTFDPQVVNSSECLSLQELSNRHLLSYAPHPGTAKLVPDLADSVPTSVDERTWTYHLKSGLRFEDGSPITAADVKYGIERSFASELGGGSGSYAVQFLAGAASYHGPYASAKGLDSIHTPDSKTIVFHLQRPFPEWNNVMAAPLSTPVPKAKDSRGAYGRHPIATGPYKFEATGSATGAVLVRNRYWDRASDPSRTALPDRVQIHVSPDVAPVQVSLVNGTTDYAPQFPVTGSVLAQAASDPPLNRRIEAINGYSAFLLAPVTAVKPLDNVHCRRAVAWTVDRQSYQVQSTGRDGGATTTRILPPPYSQGKVADPYPGAGSAAALKNARAELARCGHPRGFTTKIGYLAGSSGGVDALAASLAKVGIVATPSVLFDIGVPASVVRGGYGLLVTNWGPDWPSPYSYFDPLVASSTITATGNSNLGLVRDRVVDGDITAALEASTPAARQASWQELESYLLEQSYLVPLTVGRAEILRSARLTNVYVSDWLTQYDMASLGLVP